MGNGIKKTLKKCFVITPIGEDNSEIRKKADGVIHAILEPVLSEMDYEIIVPHEIAKTGSITQQIVEHIVNDDLVIANLTGLNANVMYELATRHCIKKPVVCITEKGTQLPFDIITERIIMYDDNFSNVLSLRNQIKKAINSFPGNKEIDNPIYRSIKDIDIMKQISENNDPNSNILKLILNRLNKIEKNVYTNDKYITQHEYNESFFALIKLGKNKINDKILNDIASMITGEFYSKGITIAIVYNKEHNEIKIANGNFHEDIIQYIMFELATGFELLNIEYELHPF